MNAIEVNALLTEGARLDPRLRRSNPEERADMAESWARLLVDVDSDAARWALDEHYTQSRDVLMPADVIELADEYQPVRNASWIGNVTEQRLAAEAAGHRPALTPGVDGV